MCIQWCHSRVFLFGCCMERCVEIMDVVDLEIVEISRRCLFCAVLGLKGQTLRTGTHPPDQYELCFLKRIRFLGVLFVSLNVGDVL